MGRRIRFELLIVLFALCSIAVFAESFEWAAMVKPEQITFVKQSYTQANKEWTEYFPDNERVFVMSSGPFVLGNNELCGKFDFKYTLKDSTLTPPSDEVFEDTISKTWPIGHYSVTIPAITPINKVANSVHFLDLNIPDKYYYEDEYRTCYRSLKATFNYTRSTATGAGISSVTVRNGIKQIYGSDDNSNLFVLLNSDINLFNQIVNFWHIPIVIRTENPKILLAITDASGMLPAFTKSLAVSEVPQSINELLNMVVYTCLDADENGQCDYEVGDVCYNTLLGDFYNFSCCSPTAQYKPTEYVDELNALCTKDENDNPLWIPLEYVGEIFEFPDAGIVSNGTDYFVCGQRPTDLPSENSTVVPDNSFFAVKQGDLEHEYYCSDGNVIECGGKAPFSSLNFVNLGYRLDLSQPIDNSDLYYCAEFDVLTAPPEMELPENGSFDCSGDFCDYTYYQDENQTKFIRCDLNKENCDLECIIDHTNNDFVACFSASYLVMFEKTLAGWVKNLDAIYHNEACYAAGFNYTGTKCCGEQPDEYYNDPWTTEPLSPTPGICWNSTYVPDGTIFQNYSMLVYKGTNQSCDKKGTDVCLAPLPDVDDQDNAALCTPNGWIKGLEADLTGLTKKSTLWETEINESCCKPSECWNGTSCVPASATIDAGDFYYYCIAGDWVTGFTKTDWNNVWPGFCQEDSQCLVSSGYNLSITDPDAFWEDNPGKRPMCINDGESILDNFCNNGSWTSRTGMLAADLYSIADDSGLDFTIFCDSPENVLLDISDLDNDCKINNKPRKCINNVCLAKFGDNLFIASTLNVDVDDEDKSFVRYFADPHDFYELTVEGDEYFKGYDSDVWYNNKIKSVISAPDYALLTPITRSNIAQTKFQDIKNYVELIAPNTPTNYYFFKDPSFSNVFFAKNGQKEIFSFLETNKTFAEINYLGIDFKNINLNTGACDSIADAFRDTNCGNQPSPDHFYLAAYDITNSTRWLPATLPSLTNYWQDLTAKVRLK